MKKQNSKTKTAITSNGVLAAGGLMKKMWVVISEKGVIDYRSISIERKGAIMYFIKDAGMNWDECKAYGWSVLKVKVKFTACS
jgi:hypothetical protein